MLPIYIILSAAALALKRGTGKGLRRYVMCPRALATFVTEYEGLSLLSLEV